MELEYPEKNGDCWRPRGVLASDFRFAYPARMGLVSSGQIRCSRISKRWDKDYTIDGRFRCVVAMKLLLLV